MTFTMTKELHDASFMMHSATFTLRTERKDVKYEGQSVRGRSAVVESTD